MVSAQAELRITAPRKIRARAKMKAVCFTNLVSIDLLLSYLLG
jgi:hypothetical protein